MTGNDTTEIKRKYKKPVRTFEKAGVVNPETSYYVPLENVVNTDKHDIKTMVDQGRYFSIFAPRQSGKTTFLKRFCQELQKDRTYVAILLSFEKYSKLSIEKFYAQIQKNLYNQLIDRLTSLDCDKLEDILVFLDQHQLTDHISFGELFEELNRIIRLKKIVVFIDEFDGIPLDELESFLTTIRTLYLEYKEVEQKALYSIGLIGIRNITKLVLGGVSPFNIADQVNLPPFSFRNVRDLFAQYTEETNQPITAGALKKIYEDTGGQPWLVNRLGTILTVDIKPGTIEPIGETDVENATAKLLLEKNSHFANLYEKAISFKETFVEIVFDHVEYTPDDPHQSWLEQYGLVKRDGEKAIVSNAIYKARYLKAFFKKVQAHNGIGLQDYLLPDGRLDMENILLDFEQYIARIGVGAFYRKPSGPVSYGTPPINKPVPYEKTGQFLLTAWLYQFARGEYGEIRYEIPSGLGRMDIMLNYKGRKYIIETKINRGNLNRTINSGIAQLTKKYLASESVKEGYLVIFDIKTPSGEECEPQSHDVNGKKITCFTIGIGKVN